MDLNKMLLHFFNEFAGKWHILDVLANDLIKIIPIIMSLTIAIIYFIGFFNNKIEYRHMAVSVFCFLVMNLTVGFIMTHIYYKPRPIIAEEGKVNSPVPHVDDSSFPSDHITVTTSLTIAVFSLFKVLGYIFIFLTVIIGIDKIYLGHHYPTDIILTVVYVVLMRIIYNKVISKHIIRFYDFIEKKLIKSV